VRRCGKGRVELRDNGTPCLASLTACLPHPSQRSPPSRTCSSASNLPCTSPPPVQASHVTRRRTRTRAAAVRRKQGRQARRARRTRGGAHARRAGPSPRQWHADRDAHSPAHSQARDVHGAACTRCVHGAQLVHGVRYTDPGAPVCRVRVHAPRVRPYRVWARGHRGHTGARAIPRPRVPPLPPPCAAIPRPHVPPRLHTRLYPLRLCIGSTPPIRGSTPLAAVPMPRLERAQPRRVRSLGAVEPGPVYSRWDSDGGLVRPDSFKARTLTSLGAVWPGPPVLDMLSRACCPGPAFVHTKGPPVALAGRQRSAASRRSRGPPDEQAGYSAAAGTGA
jgi:hypothetical protein